VIRSNQEATAGLTRRALAQRAAADVGVPEELAERVVSSFLQACKESLLQGERVDLDGLLDLGVVVEPARIERDASGRFSQIAPASTRLDVQVGDDLRDRLSTRRTAAVLLAMPDTGAFGQILEEHFDKLGWQAQRVDSADACMEMLDGSRPYLLVCDHALEGRDALVASIKANWRTNTIPVVTLHTRFDDLRRPEGLLVMGDLAVFEPISVHPLLRSLDQVLAQASEEAAVFERQIHFRLPAREDEILRAFDLSDSFFKDSGFRGDALVGLTTSFREAVRNAELHGCASDPENGVEIELLLDREKLTAIIEDDGEGFDHAAYREQLEGAGPVSMARERHESGRDGGGLGIYLMNRCADRLEYSESGNRVTLTKYREQEG
jgi:anti-sigma regulatory factor (Ser/Thr protein kinase)/nucleoid DNA-binding protein/CheY-like chemotaxis protein